MSRARTIPRDRMSKRRRYLYAGVRARLAGAERINELTVFLNATKYVVDIVWEEASRVKHRLD